MPASSLRASSTVALSLSPTFRIRLSSFFSFSCSAPRNWSAAWWWVHVMWDGGGVVIVGKEAVQEKG